MGNFAMEYGEVELLGLARARLMELLPAQFEISDAVIDGQGTFGAPDALWQVREQNTGFGLVLVEGKRSFTPRDVARMHERLSGPVLRLMRFPTVLAVAPWLSPRTRELLEEYGYSYLDLTGNVRFRVERPAVYIRLQGADRDPQPSRQSRQRARLQGPKARRLVRLLVDTVPPYRSVDLAKAGGLTPGYVSKLLESLDEQALVERDRRGLVKDTNWAGLLLAAAQRYDLFRNNAASTFVAQAGARELYASLRNASDRPDVVITGSFAVADIAKVTAPTQLVLYVRDPHKVRQFGRLLPTDRGADVVLLEPEDLAQLSGTGTVDGLACVGLSQLALDCLGGNGRLPEEGRELLDWMRSHERAWRRQELLSIDAVAPVRPGPTRTDR